MNDIVSIVSYDPVWPKQYEEEKDRLKKALGLLSAQIDHIGSTAVPGLGAKPIIDIMITLNNIAEINGCISPLIEIGYEHLGENGIPGRHFFSSYPKRPASARIICMSSAQGMILF